MAKIRTNLSLESELVAEAKSLKVNMSLAAESGIVNAVRKAREEAWRRDNAAAIISYNEWVDENGIPLSEFRQF